MASTVTRCQANIAPLGCGGMEEPHHGWMSSLQMCTICVVSKWTEISEECFQDLVESLLRRIKAALEAKRVRWQGVANIVASECMQNS